MENQRTLSYADVASTLVAAPGDPYLPPGYRFVPTDEELITEYLARKINCQSIPVKDIHAVDLYQFSPQHLAERYPQLADKEWYYFTPRDRKYPNGNRPKRSVEGVGFWKATGADKSINSNTGELVGKKKVLVFYLGKPKSPDEKKTNWIMHEYKLNKPSRKPGCNDMKLDDWVLCRVYEKITMPKKPIESSKKRKIAAPVGEVDGNIIMAPTPLAEKQECANYDYVGDPGNMVMAPPLAENNQLFPAGNQEAAPIDNSHRFPGSYEYPDGIMNELATVSGNMVMAPPLAENNQLFPAGNPEAAPIDNSHRFPGNYEYLDDIMIELATIPGSMTMAPPLDENNRIFAAGNQEAAPIDNSHQFPGSYEYHDGIMDELATMAGSMIMAPPLDENNQIAGAGSQEAAPIDNSHQFPGSYEYPDGIMNELATMAGSMSMAPPLDENNHIAGAGNQEAAPIDNSHQFPGSCEYPVGIRNELVAILMAGAGCTLLHDPVEEMIYSQNNNFDHQLPLNVQHQLPPLQQIPWQNSGILKDSFRQDVSNFIDVFQYIPETENGLSRQGARTGGQGNITSSMDGRARTGGQGNRAASMDGRARTGGHVNITSSMDGRARTGGQGNRAASMDGRARTGGHVNITASMAGRASTGGQGDDEDEAPQETHLLKN